jgi:hypothetical protein
MLKRVELIFVTRQETIILLRAKTIVIEHVHVAIRMRYNEPIFNQQNGSIIREVPRDWSRGIDNENKVPKTKLSTLHILPLNWTLDQ